MEAYGIREVSTRRGVELPDIVAIHAYGAHSAVSLRVVVAPACCSALHLVGKLLVAHLAGKGGKGVVCNIVLQGVRHGVVTRHILRKDAHGDVATLDVWVDVGAYGVVLALGCCRALHGLVGRLDVEIAQALEVAIHDYRDCGVALHGEGLAAVELPAWQPAPLLAHGNHRAKHVGLHLGVCKRKQLMHIAVGVPQ